ncbi:DUF4143 domain-containing protein [Sinorhizobium americanum]|uniref:DUF4143 domain-containing protein n=1 Tax=Sinorhizobium americanum TaxID=194963 RepID=A0A1L3LZ38_9HYPH|nr:DUF4143 domain-containing protein [Sinorhizobium americanum]APG95379.1 hypothetical protein SAMCFNEI73_pC1675 [Sinorhizobium americanum]
MHPIDGLEIADNDIIPLWVRGGFPDSFLAVPSHTAETLRRFWTMLAHHQSGLLNAAEFARALGVDGKTVASYLDLLAGLLQPRQSNLGKRLVRSPRGYVRDSE